jgi:hypothetical protein
MSITHRERLGEAGSVRRKSGALDTGTWLIIITDFSNSPLL